MSKSKSKSASWDPSEEEDDVFFQQWAQQKKLAMQMTPIDPMKIVVDFLKNTSIPYAIIGGKAAAFHLQNNAGGSPTTRALAVSTNDYDVIVEQAHGKRFVDELQRELKSKTSVLLDEKFYESEMVDIVLMGVTKKGMFDSIVDVHIVKKTKQFPKKIVKDAFGMKYADKDWICKELAYSMKYHTSADEMTKALKRKARMELLKCNIAI